ncbi:unnamed protein product [Cuscuta epithymum]|uniref:Prolamin-like domain-containing protein n=1 Tax=Cuscuta epithymum TaxID=186058 RepID=A0AAV0C6Z4_9ASTE|nr:unnamed protein product [Cuscuta epithymum]
MASSPSARSMSYYFIFIIAYYSPMFIVPIESQKSSPFLNIPFPFFPFHLPSHDNNNNNYNIVPKSSFDIQKCWGSMDHDMAVCMVEANAFLGRSLPQAPRLSTTCCMAFKEMTDRCAKNGFAFDVFIPPLVKEYCGFGQ